MWNVGDVLTSNKTGSKVIFKGYNKDEPNRFIGTDTDGDTFDDWIVEYFYKEGENETQNHLN